MEERCWEKKWRVVGEEVKEGGGRGSEGGWWERKLRSWRGSEAAKSKEKKKKTGNGGRGAEGRGGTEMRENAELKNYH